MKKGKRKKKKCSLYKSETNFCKMWCDLMWCLGQCWEECLYKKDISMSFHVSHVFINDW